MATETRIPNPAALINRTRLRRLAFYVTVLTLLGLLWTFLGDTLVLVFDAWFANSPSVHHLHDLAMVTILWAVVVGLLAQLYAPGRRVGAMQQALLVTVAITGVNLLTGFLFPPAFLLGGLLLAAAALHPSGRGVLRVRTSSLDPLLAGLLALAVVPLFVYAVDQYALQASGDAHAQLGHYADMITYVVLVLALGILAALRPLGWRVPLWTAGGLAAVLGLASVLFPTLASSAGPIWGGLALLWGVAFVAVGEVSNRRTDAAYG